MGKTAVITGGTKGIGRAIGLRLAASGFDLAVSYRRDQEGAERFQTEVADLGRRCLVLQADQTEEDAIDRLFDATEKELGGLDVFVANAAATRFVPLMHLKPHQIDKTLAVTVRAFILGTQRSVPLMKGRGGHVIAVSGMDTVHTVPFHGLLGAAKSAIETLVRYFAAELAADEIRVNGVNPGIIDTDSTRFYGGDEWPRIVEATSRLTPSGRVGTAEDVAGLVDFLVNGDSSYINGTTLHVDGGLQASFALSAALAGRS